MDLPWIITLGCAYVVGVIITFFIILAVQGFMNQTGNGKDQVHPWKAFLIALAWPLFAVLFMIWVFTAPDTHPARRTTTFHSAPPPH